MGAWAYINKTRGEKEGDRKGGWGGGGEKEQAEGRERMSVRAKEGEKLKRKEPGKKALNKKGRRKGKSGQRFETLWEKNSPFELSAVDGGRDEEQGRGRERKKFNLLKILQIAPVHNSPKLPTNQGRVPITLPLHGDQITLWICVQRGREKKGRGRVRETDGGRRREERQHPQRW